SCCRRRSALGTPRNRTSRPQTSDSYQWRAYLLMFAAVKFDYEVFQARYGDDNTIVIYDHHPLSFYAYPGMREDVLTLVSSLAEIVVKHVPEKIMSEAA